MLRKSDTPGSSFPPAGMAGALPAAVLAGSACAIAWFDHGSIAAGDWLPYAVVAALLAAAILLSGAAAAPTRTAAVGLASLLALAVFEAASAAWSPVPSLARDEALLTTLFVIGVACPLLAAHRLEARLACLWVAAIGFGGFAVVTAITLLAGKHPETRFFSGRLYFPITYSNAQAALFLAGFWPGVVLACRRAAPVPARAVALAAASAAGAGALLAQSKGSLLGVVCATLVVAVVTPARLRVLLAAALAALPCALAAGPLTEPFRAADDAHSIRRAGGAVLVVTLVGAAVGAAYALIDRRLDLTARRRAIAVGTGTAAVAALVLGATFFLVTIGSPTRWVDHQWNSFKTYHRDTGSTHFTNLGSNRYDFWRRSLQLFVDHPIAGCGARCFGPEYLLDRRSPERPKRAHSLILDTAAEEGVVGLTLLIGGFSALLYAVGRAARRRRGPGIAALASTTGFLAQAAVDWTWTFPAVGIAYALVLGLGAADSARGPLTTRTARAGAIVAVLVATVAFAPPWLAAELTTRALSGSSNARADLRWARRLDPLSTAPIIAQALTARDLGSELAYLREAVRKEPRVVDNRYFLGVALLNSGHRAEARAELTMALRLDPGNPSVTLALARSR